VDDTHEKEPPALRPPGRAGGPGSRRAGAAPGGPPARGEEPRRDRAGRAVVIGLDRVDPGHYAGWTGRSHSAEADARDLAALLEGRGFAVRRLLAAKATRPAVLREIDRLASSSQAGDIFALVFAGFGGKLPDLNGDEPYGEDRTWCLYDAQLVDEGAIAPVPKILRDFWLFLCSNPAEFDSQKTLLCKYA